MAPRRRSWTVVHLPAGDLAETVFAFAAPLLDALGPVAPVDDARRALELAVAFWNASVLASKRWDRPQRKALDALKARLRGPGASPQDVATFDLLAARSRAHWLDPRLVARWTYEPDASGAPRFACTMALPEGVEAAVPPPLEARIAVGGRFLDEVQIPTSSGALLGYPVGRHRGVVGLDGTATVRTVTRTALQLFAAGIAAPVGGAPVEVSIGGRALGPMVLTALRVGDWMTEEVELVFRPAR